MGHIQKDFGTPTSSHLYAGVFDLASTWFIDLGLTLLAPAIKAIYLQMKEMNPCLSQCVAVHLRTSRASLLPLGLIVLAKLLSLPGRLQFFTKAPHYTLLTSRECSLPHRRYPAALPHSEFHLFRSLEQD